MRVELRLPRTRFAVAEAIPLEVTITNDGPGVVDLPDPFHADGFQPTYTLVGTALQGPQTFSFGSVARRRPQPAPGAPSPPSIRLDPGASVSSDVPLAEWAKIASPGRYQIVAQLAWAGLTVTSNAVVFDVEAFALVSASLGVDVGVPSARDVWVAWLREGQGGRVLGDAVFQERRPDLGEMERLSMSPAATVGPAATDALAPFTNYDRKAQLSFYRVYREGSELCALAAGAAQPERVDLGPEAAVLRPALMTERGELDVFALAGATNELLLARFAPRAAPRLARGAVIPGRLLAARAALSPLEGGSARHLVVTTEDDDGTLLLHHVDAQDGSRLDVVRTISLRGVSPLAQSRPALRVSAQGAAEVALLVETDREARGFALLQVTFDRSLARIEPRETPLGELPRPAWAASASFVMAPGEHDRIDWAILLEGGELLTSFSPAAPQDIGLQLAFPLEILSLAKAAYVLALHPTEGPVFVLMR